jgi:hypothetical protein
VSLIEKLVDALPERLWAFGNLYMLPGGDWHFCVGAHPRDGRSVRTVEWRGREIARGYSDFEAPDAPADLDIGEWVDLWRWGYYPGHHEAP